MPKTAQNKDPFYLRLPTEQQKYLDLAVCRRVRDTVMACADRDDELKSFRMQLEGWAQPDGNLPWPGACELSDSISRELHTTTTAAMWSAAKQVPYVCLEAVDRNDIDEATDRETWLTIKAQQFSFEKALYDAIYLANEGRFSAMYCGHRQAIKRTFEIDQPEQDEYSADPSVQPDPQLIMRETPVEDLIEFRVPNPWDFYVFPVNSRGPQMEDGAIQAIERICLTREDLAMGVLTEGYLSDQVDAMLDKGPSAIVDDGLYAGDADENDRDGLNPGAIPADRENGTWECFLVIGRSPLLLDDRNHPTIPEAMIHTDCLWMCCPALDIVFKQTYSPFPDAMRPYSIYNVIDKPNRMLGEGIVSILCDTQSEMTAIARFGINNMNLEASPMMSVSESWLSRYSKWTVAPARFMPRQASDPIGPRPIVWDIKSQALIMPWLQVLDAKAGRLAASQSVNSAMSGRVRKAAEIHFAEAMQQMKFDLFLANIQRGVQQTFRILSSTLQELINRNGEDTVFDSQGRKITMTAAQLKAKFRFLPQASSDSMSPAQRLARQQTITQIVMQYWQGLPQFMQMQAVTYWYSLNHRLLVLAGERSPERYIGQEPGQQQPNPMAAMAAAQPGGQNGASSGNGSGLQLPGFPMGAEGGAMLQASPLSPHPTNGAMALNGAG